MPKCWRSMSIIGAKGMFWLSAEQRASKYAIGSAGPRRRLGRGREGRRIADRGGVHLEVVADGADDPRTGVNPDPHLQLEAARGGGRLEGGEGVGNRERGAHGGVRSVLVGDRGAEE